MLRWGGAGLGALALSGLPAAGCGGGSRGDTFRFLVIEANPAAGTHRILNWELIEWYSHDTEPYVEVA